MLRNCWRRLVDISTMATYVIQLSLQTMDSYWHTA